MRKGENSSKMGEDSPRKSDQPPCKKSKTNHHSENPSISILEPFTHLALPEELITEILLRLPVKPLSKTEDYKGGALADDTVKYTCGKIHWIVSNPGEKWKIVSLDITNEKRGELNMPDFWRGVDDWNFGVVDGRLFLLLDYENTNADLWVMNIYGVEESWAKLVSIPYGFHPGLSSNDMLANNEILLAVGPVLLVYNSKDNKFSNLFEGDDYDFFSGVCIESLASPTAYGGLHLS